MHPIRMLSAVHHSPRSSAGTPNLMMGIDHGWGRFADEGLRHSLSPEPIPVKASSPISFPVKSINRWCYMVGCLSRSCLH